MPVNIEVSKSKQTWLAQKLHKLKDQPSSLQISPQSRPDHLPLAFSQKRLWFLEQWQPGSFGYLLSYAWNLQGSLDIHALTSTLNQLVLRHESLRTTFSTYQDHPIQIIRPTEPILVPLIDLSEQIKERQETECQRLIQEEAKQGFDLQADPLVRMKILRLRTEEHILLLTLHHIITDGWSMSIFLREFSTLYTNQITGQSPQLPQLPLQFADFAIWQQQWLQGEELDRQLQYWRNQLHNIPQQIEFPIDFPRPAQQTYEGNSISFTLSEPVVQSFQALCRSQGMTLFMALLASFQVLLFRYSGQRDICVGTPIAGRSHSEFEGLIGFFVNTLVIRKRFKGNPTFQEVLNQTRETCLEAYTNQDLPFEKLVEVLQPVRDPSQHPLFQIMFQLHHRAKNEELTLPNVNVQALPRTNHTAKFDLSLALTSDTETIKGNFTFNTAIFQFSTIQRLTCNFHTLLENLLKNPTQPVGQIPLLTDIEQHQLLVELNDRKNHFSPDNTVHELFAKQAALTPDAIAVVDDDQQITYRELNERANRLAYFLQSKGVNLEDRVGICLDRGIDLIISFLGVLKSGGTYVPIDLSTPTERLRFMTKHARALIVITSESCRAQVPFFLNEFEESGQETYSLLTLEMVWDYSFSENSVSHLPIVHPENLAYVMYTSGSTGMPKGVDIPHRGIVRLVKSPAYLQDPQNLVFLQLASPAFDAATFEIWTCLVNGGTLILGPTQLPSLDDFGELLQKFQITILWLTSGLFHQMVDWNLQALNTVTRLIAGGDILSPHHVKRVRDQLPSCLFINGYGPTENTTFTCCYPIQSDVDCDNPVPIGKPIEQTQVYMLDSRQYLLPIGVPGELCIGGVGLARGYHDQPGLTAERFIPHPYSSMAGDRLYRSGDIVRYRNRGYLEFLGRRDHQIKIRGYRIECGEIETILSRHSAIKETVVLSRKDHVKNTLIVAYIVLTNGSTPSTSDLRNFLNQTLPSYMIPTEYVFLDAFPLTSNGKVDRNKLPTDGQNSPNAEEIFVAPRNSLETQLTKIWETVLGRQPIGVTENFFNLGGESLIAVRLCSEMEKALQTKIPVPMVFHAQTIEQLAKKIVKSLEYEHPSLLVPIQLSGSNPPIFCFGFASNFRRYLKDYRKQPIYMFLSPGEDGRPILNRTVEKIATLCMKEMRTVQPEGPYYLAGFSFGGPVVYEMAQQLRKQGATIGLLALIDPTTPLSKPAPLERKIRLNHLLSTTRHQINEMLTNLNTISPSIFTKTQAALQWRLKKKIGPLEFKLKKMLCKVYFGFGYPLPKFLRRFYQITMFRQAARQYSPQNYPGQVVIFQTNISIENYWSKLCAEVEKIYDLPCKHMEIHMDGSHVPRFLQQLMDCLEKAQQKHG